MATTPGKQGEPSPNAPAKPPGMNPLLAGVLILFGFFMLIISLSSAWDMLAHGGTVMDGASYRNAAQVPRPEAVTRAGTPFTYWFLVFIKLALSFFSLLLILAGFTGIAANAAQENDKDDNGDNDRTTST